MLKGEEELVSCCSVCFVQRGFGRANWCFERGYVRFLTAGRLLTRDVPLAKCEAVRNVSEMEGIVDEEWRAEASKSGQESNHRTGRSQAATRRENRRVRDTRRVGKGERRKKKTRQPRVRVPQPGSVRGAGPPAWPRRAANRTSAARRGRGHMPSEQAHPTTRPCSASSRGTPQLRRMNAYPAASDAKAGILAHRPPPPLQKALSRTSPMRELPGHSPLCRHAHCCCVRMTDGFDIC